MEIYIFQILEVFICSLVAFEKPVHPLLSQLLDPHKEECTTLPD